MPKPWLNIAERIVRESSRERPADRVLRETLKSAKSLTPEERTSISEAVFAYFRWKGWLGQNRVASEIQRALELEGAYAKNHASIKPAELLARTIPEWVIPYVNPETSWFASLQKKPKLWVRARRQHLESLLQLVGEFDRPFPHLPEALVYTGTQNLFRLPSFQEGWFELQDVSSQAVGILCDPKPKQTWWDACAGEGGKTLHLSDLMENKGMIWASDRAAWRLEVLKKRTGRAQVFNYRTTVWTNPDQLPTKTKFDGILVDAPCSGVGTWQRNPHARWTLEPSDVAELSAVQQKLLQQCAAQLKPGGRLLYSVCTLTQAETHDVCDAFEKAFPTFKPLPLPNPFAGDLVAPRHLFWPQATQGGGMFVAAWRS